MARPSAEEPQRHRTNYRQLFSFAVVSGLICWLIEYPIQPVFAATNQNQLLVGETALLETASLIPLQEPQDFDGLTTEEVLRLRMQTVWQQPLLIGKDYEPTELIFGRLRNRADWRRNVSAWSSSQNNDGLSFARHTANRQATCSHAASSFRRRIPSAGRSTRRRCCLPAAGSSAASFPIAFQRNPSCPTIPRRRAGPARRSRRKLGT